MARILPRSGKTARCARTAHWTVRGFATAQLDNHQGFGGFIYKTSTNGDEQTAAQAARGFAQRNVGGGRQADITVRRFARIFLALHQNLPFQGCFAVLRSPQAAKAPVGPLSKLSGPAFVSGAPANKICRVRTKHAAARRGSRQPDFARRNAARRFAQRNAAHYPARQGLARQFWMIGVRKKLGNPDGLLSFFECIRRQNCQLKPMFSCAGAPFARAAFLPLKGKRGARTVRDGPPARRHTVPGPGGPCISAPCWAGRPPLGPGFAGG